MPPRFFRRLLCAVVLLGFAVTGVHAKPADWNTEIDALTKDDVSAPPPKGGIVFVGSSSIRLWDTLATDFPQLPVIRRGFGGSQLADSTHFLDRIVLPYQPKTIVLYAGENDLAEGVSPQKIAANFDEFCTKLHASLPQARIVYLAMKPSPFRWHLAPQMREGNALIAAACARDPRLQFIDVFTAMLGPDGQTRPELYRDDHLHMVAAGYAIWTGLLTPLLAKP